MKNQFNQGNNKRLMYVENKEGDIDGYTSRIGWVTFSKSGRSVYYRDLMLEKMKGGGISGGNYYCEATGHEYWVSGVKKRGSNTHWAEGGVIHIDEDASEEYEEHTK